MKFTYTARNNQGKLEKGEMEIPSEHDLAQYLRSKDLILTHAETQNNKTENGKKTIKLPWLQRVSAIEKIFFTQNLQVMVRSGLSISVALKTLAEQTTNKSMRIILLDVQQKVDRGIPLSDSLAEHPKIFSELFVSMVRAGEKSGKLDEVLLQITNQLRKSHALIAKVKGALTYPVIVIIAMLGIGTAMMVYVIPQMTSIFQEVNATLPLPTLILIETSNFLVNNGLWVLLGTILIVVTFVQFIHTKKGKQNWHGFLLKLPIVSSILKKINLAKFARTFSSLLKTDIPIVQAFQITASTLSNVLYREALVQTGEGVKKGVAVSNIIRGYPKLFPPLIAQMIAVGEETGTLDNILEELAQFYEDDVDRTMGNLATIIEPVLMIVLGFGVGGMAIAIIMPMYSLSQSI
jgi:type IV pilus assembly protein PilC